MMADYLQIILRVFVAAVATSLLGLERSRRPQLIGMRTFGLIGVGGAATGIMAVHMGGIDSTAFSRALQGVVMGVGFLGAGAIVHPATRSRTVGVTTAAAIWVAAVIGFAAGIGEWVLTGAGLVFSLLLLVLPEPAAVAKVQDERDEDDMDDGLRP